MAFRLTVRDMSTPRKLATWLYPAVPWLVILALAVAVGMYASAPQVLAPAGAGRMFPRIPQAPDLRTLLWMLGVGSPVWYAVFVALPVLLWVARRTDLSGQSRLRVAGFGILGLLALVALTSWIQYAITFTGAPSKPPFPQYLPQALQQNLLPWIALAGIVLAVESRRHAVQLAVERERLRTGMVEQRLVALTSQLQPHFLFNTLQGISTLIHRDPDAADQMLGKLADLLRDVLRDRDRVLVPLADEIRYARTYLEISKLRFGDRLQYDIDVPRDLEGVQVPLFILQPLVENAISHGIGSRIQGGRVGVRAYRQGGSILLDVEDDGGGFDDAAQLKEGIGLSNTRERLRASFGGEGRFQLTRNGKTTIARLEILEIRTSTQ
jgi:two-component system LytT family sensor kinase